MLIASSVAEDEEEEEEERGGGFAREVVSSASALRLDTSETATVGRDRGRLVEAC
jgi:hypothetical protein